MRVKKESDFFLFSGIFLFSASVLLFELSLTRVFSILQWNYLAFMIISLAFLGYGASGTFLSVFSSWRKKAEEGNLFPYLIWSSLLFSGSSLFSVLIILKIPFDLYRLIMDRDQIIYLIIYYLAIAIPFFWAGICISLAISSLPEKVNKIYFSDLGGASLGCISFLFLASYISLSKVLIIPSLLSFLASFFFSLKIKNIKKLLVYSFGLILFIFLFSQAEGFYSFPVNPYKSLFALLRYPQSKIIEKRENSFARLEIVESKGVKYAPGLSLKFSGEIPEQLGMVTDGDGLSAITKLEGISELEWSKKIEFADYISSALGFHLLKDKENQNKIMIIGPGGGLDILGAIYHHIEEIWGIKMNPEVKTVMQNNFASYSGNIYLRPEVKILTGEGRSILTGLEEKFDLLQISLIGSSNTASGGFYSISENYLYTVEGIKEFWKKLTTEGMINITRWIQFPPREILRLCSIGLEALHQVGIERPENHLIIIRSWATITFIISKKEITWKEINITKDFCNKRGFDIVYFPGVKEEETNIHHVLEKDYYYQEINQLVKSFSEKKQKDYYNSYFFNVTPVTDDRPYFFYTLKWKNIPRVIKTTDNWQPLIEWGNLIIFATFVQGIIFSIIFIFLPLLFKRFPAIPKRIKFPSLFYFACLGFGYMLLEISFLQKFILYLHHPSYATSLVIFSFLLFSGWGSFYSRKMEKDYLHILKRVIILLFFILILYQLLLSYLFSVSLKYSLSLKILIAILLISPLGFLMGMPFPLGIKLISSLKQGKEIIPWLWATNSFCSILASVSAVIIALSFGFRVVSLLAGLIYLAGMVSINLLGKAQL